MCALFCVQSFVDFVSRNLPFRLTVSLVRERFDVKVCACTVYSSIQKHVRFGCSRVTYVNFEYIRLFRIHVTLKVYTKELRLIYLALFLSAASVITAFKHFMNTKLKRE